MGSDDMDRQNDELTVMKEIFTKNEFNEQSSGTDTYALFEAHPTLPVNFTLLLTKDSGKTDFKVNYLPPIRLSARLLPDYPSQRCPEITLSCLWLSRDKLSKLVEELDKLWSDNKCEILFIWCSFLKDQSLQFLNIFDSYDLIERYPIYFNHEGNRGCQRKEQAAAKNAGINKSCSPFAPTNKFNRDYQHFKNEENGSSEECQKQEKVPIENVDSNNSWYNSENSSNTSMKCLHLNHQVNLRSDGCRRKEKMSVENADTNNSWSHFASSSKKTRMYPQSSRKSKNEKASKFEITPSVENEFLLKGIVKLDRKGLELLNSYRKEAVNKLYYDLIEYNAEKSSEEFNRHLQDCNVCFSSVIGESCKKLSCGHVTCIDCLRRMFEVHIKHGTMDCIVCAEGDCGLEIPLSLIQELLSKELFEKYDQLMLNRTLDKITNMTYCPRITCQYPVSVENEDSLAICPNCSNAFCVYCKRTYHGMEGCKMETDEKRELIILYQNGNFEKKLELEKRYGKKQLTEIVNAAKSEMWMSENSKKCPCCRINIEKSDGCNKMICEKCNANFCWMCQTRLSSINPYLHYQDPKSKCFNRLFEGIYNAVDNDRDDYLDDDFDDGYEDFEEDHLENGVY